MIIIAVLAVLLLLSVSRNRSNHFPQSPSHYEPNRYHYPTPPVQHYYQHPPQLPTENTAISATILFVLFLMVLIFFLR